MLRQVLGYKLLCITKFDCWEGYCYYYYYWFLCL